MNVAVLEHSENIIVAIIATSMATEWTFCLNGFFLKACKPSKLVRAGGKEQQVQTMQRGYHAQHAPESPFCRLSVFACSPFFSCSQRCNVIPQTMPFVMRNDTTRENA